MRAVHSGTSPPTRRRALSLGLAAAAWGLAFPATGQEAERYRADLEALTAPAMAGREVGTNGGELAIRHIAAAMAEAGLEPLGGKGFRQDFSLRDPAPATYLPATRLGFELGDCRRSMEVGEDAVPFRFSVDGKAEALVVFAGYGLRIPEKEWDDYAALEAGGRVVLVLRGAPRRLRSMGRDLREHVLFRTKMARAAEAGAVGVILCNARLREDREEEIGIALRARGSTEVPAFFLARPRAEELFTRGPGLHDRIEVFEKGDRKDRAAARGPLEGVRAALEVTMGPRPRDLATANVIGVLPGGDPERRGEYVVVGAHHDHLGRGRYGSLAVPRTRDRIHPGADDNASGVAGMLELARWMASTEPLPGRSVVFVAFAGEEYGQHGSRWFLDHPPIPPERIVAMINLDMIGRGESGELRIEGVSSGEGLAGRMAAAAKAAGVECELRDRCTARSDHYRFLKKRIPALHVHTGLHDQYHRPSDVSGLVEVEAAIDVVRLVDAMVRELGGGPAPVWRGGR